jgi:hypothetical protein
MVKKYLHLLLRSISSCYTFVSKLQLCFNMQEQHSQIFTWMQERYLISAFIKWAGEICKRENTAPISRVTYYRAIWNKNDPSPRQEYALNMAIKYYEEKTTPTPVGVSEQQ